MPHLKFSIVGLSKTTRNSYSISDKVVIKKFILLGQENPLVTGEAMEQAAWRSCGCSLPGSVQGQAGWSSEQPGPVEGVPAHSWRVGTQGSVSLLPTETVL